MRETKYWTWHMAAGVVILFLLGLHMTIMHVDGIAHLFAAFWWGSDLESEQFVSRWPSVLYRHLHSPPRRRSLSRSLWPADHPL